jgi:hypothetical protein
MFIKSTVGTSMKRQDGVAKKNMTITAAEFESNVRANIQATANSVSNIPNLSVIGRRLVKSPT